MKPISFTQLLYYLDNDCYVYHDLKTDKCYLVHDLDITKKLRYVTHEQYLKLISYRNTQNCLITQNYRAFEIIF